MNEVKYDGHLHKVMKNQGVRTDSDGKKRLGVCDGGDKCGYHDGKVDGNSVLPSMEVAGEKHFTQIINQIKELDISSDTTMEAIEKSLSISANYWKENHEVLEGELYQLYLDQKKICTNEGRYLAGSWMSSPEQFSQLLGILLILKEKKQLDDWSNVLRAGTASGFHTMQLTEAFRLTGVDPELEVIDQCLPPVLESMDLIPSVRGRVGNILEMDGEGGKALVTGHFMESGIGNEASTHDEAMGIKEEFFRKLRDQLKDDGMMVMGIGINTDPKVNQRFRSEEEMRDVLMKSGFNNIIIKPTTESMDYDEDSKELLPGNFIVVASK